MDTRRIREEQIQLLQVKSNNIDYIRDKKIVIRDKKQLKRLAIFFVADQY